MVYLDYAAATPLDSEVLAAMEPYFSEFFYNPSANYLASQKVRSALEAARSDVAHWLGTRSSEIIFTAGGTEANNLAIHGVMSRFPGARMLVGAIEHESVLEPAKSFAHDIIPVGQDGRIDLDALEQLIDDNSVLISIMYANNEVGTVQPIREVGALVSEIRKARRSAGNELPLYFHTDACQAANYLDLHVDRLGVDLMTLNSGKIYGPKQSGALYMKADVQLLPLIVGGGQERNRRSGTENVAGCIGFAKALQRAQEVRRDEHDRLVKLQQQFQKELTAAIPHLIINGSKKYRLPNNVHITIPGQDNERLLFGLDEAGIQAAAGSACSASNEEPSHVLRAMGVSDTDAQASLRLTMGRDTSVEMVTQTTGALIRLTSTK